MDNERFLNLSERFQPTEIIEFVKSFNYFLSSVFNGLTTEKNLIDYHNLSEVTVDLESVILINFCNTVVFYGKISVNPIMYKISDTILIEEMRMCVQRGEVI